ncbi:MAG: DUF1294 domain-containing protein [Oscillospiraceae bacterium]
MNMSLAAKTALAPTATGSTVWAVIGSPTGLLICLLLLINLVTFLTFGWDKLRAKKTAWRVPEKTLFLLSIFGGSPGALLGMRVFHHKTLHRSFRWGIPLILAAQILIPLGLWVYFKFVR